MKELPRERLDSPFALIRLDTMMLIAFQDFFLVIFNKSSFMLFIPCLHGIISIMGKSELLLVTTDPKSEMQTLIVCFLTDFTDILNYLICHLDNQNK